MELSRMRYEKVIEDRFLRRAFERLLQTLIETMIDVLRHMVSGLNLGVASSYRDYVDLCERNEVISGDLAERIRALIPIRLILVHRYRSPSYEELWRSIDDIIEVARRLEDEIRDYLRKLATSSRSQLRLLAIRFIGCCLIFEIARNLNNI